MILKEKQATGNTGQRQRLSHSRKSCLNDTQDPQDHQHTLNTTATLQTFVSPPLCTGVKLWLLGVWLDFLWGISSSEAELPVVYGKGRQKCRLLFTGEGFLVRGNRNKGIAVSIRAYSPICMHFSIVYIYKRGIYINKEKYSYKKQRCN